jgi:hypothetical protein
MRVPFLCLRASLTLCQTKCYLKPADSGLRAPVKGAKIKIKQRANSHHYGFMLRLRDERAQRDLRASHRAHGNVHGHCH